MGDTTSRRIYAIPICIPPEYEFTKRHSFWILIGSHLELINQPWLDDRREVR